MERNQDVVRVIARLARVFETRLGERSMSLREYRLLAFLSDGDWAASAVADWLAVSRPSVTAMVDGLVERGLVERQPCATDRRKVLHQLTEAGRSALDAAAADLRDGLDGLLDHLDDDERSSAIEGLGLLDEAMRRQREVVKS